MALHAKINTHFTNLFANFVERLSKTPEGDGTLLDHSLLMYGTGMSDGQAHNDYPLPIAVVGGTSAGIRGNRFVIANERTPLANLLLGVAGTFGSRLETFGESTARMEA